MPNTTKFPMCSSCSVVTSFAVVWIWPLRVEGFFFRHFQTFLPQVKEPWEQILHLFSMSLGADAAEQFKPQNPPCPQQWDGDRASQKKQRSQRNSLSEACLPGFLCVTLLPLTNPGVSARVCEGEESQLAAAAVQCVVRLQPTVRWNQHIAYCFLYDWETLDDLSCFEALMMSKASFPCYACCCLLCTICYICFQAVTLTTAHQLAYLSVYLSPLRILVSNKCSCSSLGRCWGTATNTSNAAHLLMHIMSLLFTYGDGVKEVTTHVLKESVKLHFLTRMHIFFYLISYYSVFICWGQGKPEKKSIPY